MPFDVADGCAACGRQTRWMQHHLTSAFFFYSVFVFCLISCFRLWCFICARFRFDKYVYLWRCVFLYVVLCVSYVSLPKADIKNDRSVSPGCCKTSWELCCTVPEIQFENLYPSPSYLLVVVGKSVSLWRGREWGWTLIDRRVLRKKTSAESGLSPIVFELQYLYRYTHSFICDCNERQAPKKWFAAAVSAHPCVYLPRQSRTPLESLA